MGDPFIDRSLDRQRFVDRSVDWSIDLCRLIDRLDRSIHRTMDGSSAERSINLSTDRSTDVSIDRSIERTINRSINQSIFQPPPSAIDRSFVRSIHRPIGWPTARSFDRSIDRLIDWPMLKPRSLHHRRCSSLDRRWGHGRSSTGHGSTRWIDHRRALLGDRPCDALSAPSSLGRPDYSGKPTSAAGSELLACWKTKRRLLASSLCDSQRAACKAAGGNSKQT